MEYETNTYFMTATEFRLNHGEDVRCEDITPAEILIGFF